MVEKAVKSPILVPVDFSVYSESALLTACEWAQCLKQPIIVLHVVHDPAQMPGYYAKMTAKKHLVRIEDVANEMFEEFIKRVRKQNPDVKLLKRIRRMLVVGIPVTRILQVAEKEKASMIVMGSQGRTGLEHMMLGSKAEQVVRLSPIPVTIVK